MSNDLKITWYGRCCFLVEFEDKKILFDPYDTYCNVDIGLIASDILLSSSTWHDHGHIGASPKSHIYTYPGIYKQDDIVITGIEAMEDRGSPTVIFNVKIGKFSITNFADFGPEQKRWFDSHIAPEELKVLRSTNIAFIRPSIDGDIDAPHSHNEIALEYCNPSIIIPEHYFPDTFIEKYVPQSEKEEFLKPNIIVNELIDILDYEVSNNDSWEYEIKPQDLSSKTLLKFKRLHPQVKYLYGRYLNIHKPEILYHASSNKEITIFEPRQDTYRDPDEGPVVFATPDPAYASCFIVPTDNSWVRISRFGRTKPWNVIISDRERFEKLDKGGAIYQLASKSFYCDITKGTRESEWVSKDAVIPINKTEYSSGLAAMKQHGVNVYFVSKDILGQIDNSSDHGQAIIEALGIQ